MSSIFADHINMRLEINYKGKKLQKKKKKKNMGRLNNMLLNNQWVPEEIKEIKKCLETNESENTTIQKSMGHSKIVLRGKFM